MTEIKTREMERKERRKARRAIYLGISIDFFFTLIDKTCGWAAQCQKKIRGTRFGFRCVR